MFLFSQLRFNWSLPHFIIRNINTKNIVIVVALLFSACLERPGKMNL